MAASFTAQQDIAGSPLRRLPAALWAFLLALLFGAVAPMGLPDTLVHGAAFNPATTSVAIGARRNEQGIAVWQKAGGARQHGAPGGGAMLPAAPALAVALALVVRRHARRPAPLLRPYRRGTRRARAPPAARG